MNDDRPRSGMILVWALAAAFLFAASTCVVRPAAAADEGDVGTALVGGIASHVGEQFGRDYLALPEHRWGSRGLLVQICGDADCVTRRSTDAGPDLAMQRAGRVADLNAWDFARVCGCDPWLTGLTDVTVEYLGEIVLPPTDTEEQP